MVQVCSTAEQGNVAARVVPQPGKPQGRTETHQEPAALGRVACSPGMCEARTNGGQSLFPRQAALLSTVARAGGQVMVWQFAQQGAQGG